MGKYGLIGDPISTSGSPALYRAAYSGKGSYDLIEGSDFETSWAKFLNEYDAINVTAPFKELAFAKVIEAAQKGKALLSGPAAKIGATNLVINGENGLIAHNSDFTGIILAVAESYFPGITAEFIKEYKEEFYVKIHQFFRISVGRLFKQTPPQALVVGCGGAGRAAAVAAAELGFATALMNRTAEKAQAIASAIPEYGFIADPMSDFKAAVKECDLVIYTLPVSIPEISELTADDFLNDNSVCGKVILEANYKDPSFGEVEQIKMKSAEATYVSGREWLLGQAVTGYIIMTGEMPDYAAMRAV